MESSPKSLESSVFDELLTAHPLKSELVMQMVNQLEVLKKEFPSTRKEGSGFNEQAGQIGRRVEKLYNFFRAVRDSQKVFEKKI